jgi:prophage DNA circulation protein
MSWNDRIQSMLYQAPQSGGQFELLFDDVSRTGGKKAPVNELPGQDQAIIQELGILTPRYPVTGYFSGPDYDQVADRFWNALDETGPATLKHPRWGAIQVIALQKEQREQFVDGAGRAVFTIEFVRADATVAEYPRVRAAVDDRITTGADTAVAAMAAAAADADTTEPRMQIAVQDSVISTLEDSRTTMQLLINQAEDHREEFNELIADITRNIDTLVLDPVTLTQRMASLFRLPALGAGSVYSKVTGYASIFATLGDTLVATAQRYSDFAASLSLANLRALLLGAAEATTVGEVPTRADAQRSVDALSQLRTDAVAAIEQIEAETESSDYETQALTEGVMSRAIEGLVARALSLPTERVMVLERYVTPIVLCWELYGDLTRLDTLIDFNRLSGDEIIMIPPGREIRWYV